MLRNKIVSILFSLVLVLTLHSVVQAHDVYNGNNSMGNYNQDYGFGMMGSGGMMGNGYNSMDGYNDGYGMMGYGGMMRMMNMMGMMMGYGDMGMGYNGMMDNDDMMGYGYGGSRNDNYSLDALNMSEEDVKNLAEKLIERQFGSAFQISDIFIFSNSSYYISIIDKDSGQGAFEFLLDPYRKTIYPEYGPNMMWNTEYGMSRMMGWSSPLKENQITRKQALESARKNAAQYDFAVEDEGHQFPGYYTFHTSKNGSTSGMLSVNSYTGQVWYHNWHGNVEKVIEIGE